MTAPRGRNPGIEATDGTGVVPARSAALPTAFLGAELNLLPPAERRVAEHILDDPAAASLITISKMSDATGASPATIVRLARRVGFDGYRDFRIALATEVGRAQGREAPLTGVDISPTDDLEALIAKVAAADIAAIHNTIDGLDIGQFLGRRPSPERRTTQPDHRRRRGRARRPRSAGQAVSPEERRGRGHRPACRVDRRRDADGAGRRPRDLAQRRDR